MVAGGRLKFYFPHSAHVHVHVHVLEYLPARASRFSLQPPSRGGPRSGRSPARTARFVQRAILSSPGTLDRVRHHGHDVVSSNACAVNTPTMNDASFGVGKKGIQPNLRCLIVSVPLRCNKSPHAPHVA